MKNRIKLFNAIKSDGLFQGKKLTIEISGEFPKGKSFLDAKKLHEEQAKLLVDTLFLSLPVETIDAILYEIIAKRTFSLKLVNIINENRHDTGVIRSFIEENTTKKA